MCRTKVLHLPLHSYGALVLEVLGSGSAAPIAIERFLTTSAAPSLKVGDWLARADALLLQFTMAP